MHDTSRWVWGSRLGLALACLLATSLHAQDSVVVIDPDAPFADSSGIGSLPATVTQQLIQTWNDSATTRLTGNVTLAPGSTPR